MKAFPSGFLAITNLKANRGVPASMRWPSAAVSAD